LTGFFVMLARTHRFAPALAIVLLLSGATRAHAQDVLFSIFRDYLESLRTQVGIPGMAAAVIGRNDVLWEQAFGRQDLERAVAARTDTPFHLSGLTQLFTTVLVLQCVEEGRLSLGDRIGDFTDDAGEPDATIEQLLTHTSPGAGGPAFGYRPDRLEPLRLAVRRCRDDSYRETLANLLERLAMVDSVPGPDILQLVPPAEGIPLPDQVERYKKALDRLATPYAVDQRRRASRSQYPVLTLTPAGGLISTVRDFAEFDLALKDGLLLLPETLQRAWVPAVGPGGTPLPYATGWFAQTYNGEPVVWQVGVEDNASSALVITLPNRGLTLVLLANSDRLVTPYALTAGDVTVSPFARSFLGIFVR
jgi:CubicO group peptidase (beta-lactamase class C family)